MPILRMESVSPAVVEQGVSGADQTMTIEKVFWSHVTPNLLPAAWVVGVLLPLLGLDIWAGLLAIVVGNLIGALPVALAGLMGPRTGLTQIEVSRFAFGKAGARFPAAINWLMCLGWDAVNNVPSAIALLALAGLAGLHVPFWLALAALVAIQILIGVYGHHLVQDVQKYVGYALLLAFAIIGFLAFSNGGGMAVAASPVSPGMIVLAISIVASYNFGWAAYASDYTRYLPAATPRRAIFWRTFLGLAFSAGLVELFGLLTAALVANPTPGAVIEMVTQLTGSFAPLALLTIGVSAIPSNALNDNTAAYSLITAGLRIPRHVAAVVIGVVSFVLSVYGSGQYTELYTNFLLLMVYWVAPWSAIVLTHWFLNRQTAPRVYPLGWTRAATIFVVVTAATIGLFAATPLYTGPIAVALGGVDIGYFVGFAAAAALYAAAVRLRFGVAAPPAAYEPVLASEREEMR